MTEPTLTELFGPVIHSYSRAQAIADGMLVDVTKTAKEAGFRYPVALTRAAWCDCVEWPESAAKRKRGRTIQDEAGRLWDVLWMAYVSIKRSRKNGSRLVYGVRRVPVEGRGHVPRLRLLRLEIGPGDTPDPVITIFLADEVD